jgi:superfamily II DNA or RNA helicase
MLIAGLFLVKFKRTIHTKKAVHFIANYIKLTLPHIAINLNMATLDAVLNVHGGMDLDLDIDIEVAEPAAKKPKKAPRVKAAGLFKKDLQADARVQQLKQHATAVAAVSVLTTAYFVPMGILRSLQIRTCLYDVLTARPKSKKFQGKETRQPWLLYHERGDWVAIPRMFGITVWGRPATVRTHEGLGITLTVTTPLLTAETCRALNGIDQYTAVGHVEKYLRDQTAQNGFGACIFCISPGYGKTSCAAHLIQRLGRKALFVVPNEPFMAQVAAEMVKFLGITVRVGTLATSDKKKWDTTNKDIVVAMARSVASINYDLSEYGTIVIDEAHEYATESNSQMFYRFGAQFVILLTATPERAADHCGAYLQWLGGPIAWLEQRDISKLRWGGVDVTIYDLQYLDHPIKDIVSKAGETYWEGITRQIVNKPIRNEFLLEHVLMPRLRTGRRILVLGTRIQHMEEMAATIQAKYQVDYGIIVGEHSDGTKLNSEERLTAQKKQIIFASVSIVAKALNIPELDTMVVLSGGSYVNNTFWQQAIGRITRDHAHKQQPELILLRDRYKPLAANGGLHGVMALCVDAACKTLAKYSPEGFRFTTYDVLFQNNKIDIYERDEDSDIDE